MGIAVVALTRDGGILAQRLAAVLDDARVHGLSGRVGDADETFTDAAGHLRALFRGGETIVGVCATGILIRALAPALSDKADEPAVVAVAPDGSSIVPLLGGHRGANALARGIADALGGHPAVTTASDTALGVALDDPPPGWHIANPQTVKPLVAEALAGRNPALVIEAGEPDWLAALPLDRDGEWMVRVSDRKITPNPRELVLNPPTLAVGVGCERGCSADELVGLVRDTLDEAGLAPESVAGIFSIDVKADEPAVHAVAEDLGVSARFMSADSLEAETPRLANPSEIVFREVGAHGVAEAAALAAAGPRSNLVVPKRKSARATCAVARGPRVEAAKTGTPRGSLTVIGTGPGDPDYRIPATDGALARATDVVGYGPYLDLLEPLPREKTRHDFDLGAEEDRCRRALDLAAQGKSVVLVSSGDPGVFAMATLVFELLDREARPEWQRIAVAVEPGVSAMQLAAARAGAPLGHDFCAISLSDLLTTRQTVIARLKAAAQADFVVALYNPASRTRRGLLETARDLLLQHRPADTPVVVARNLARAGESVEVVSLADLRLERIDMLTMVIVGNSQSRVLAHGGHIRTYTPRGYAAKQTRRKTG
ncbi:MAG: precorrin-3B C(17)-methyltransferase [Alphaproteobacteria bacterium]|nr:precorrin-3B C(17)-methyltransferase [Alphaproteobacteria bacterium]